MEPLFNTGGIRAIFANVNGAFGKFSFKSCESKAYFIFGCILQTFIITKRIFTKGTTLAISRELLNECRLYGD